MTANLNNGDTFGAYDIVKVAGSGGMSIVYQAHQRSLGRSVALKVIRPEIAESGDYRSRFLREARLAAAVDHPHIVTVFEAGEHAGLLYLAMQWVDGLDLRALLNAQHRMDPDRAVRIGVQLASALDAVHEAGLIHRDVKPSNVIVRNIGGKDHVYLTDFGIAKMPDAHGDLTRTGWVIGTPGYLSPEQIRGEEANPQSDFYALGCIIFEALTGHPPFSGGNDSAVVWASASGPRPTASAVYSALGSRYDAFLGRALAIDPRARFTSGRDFAHALRSAHAGQRSYVPQAPSAADAPTQQSVRLTREPLTVSEAATLEPRPTGSLEPTMRHPAARGPTGSPPPAVGAGAGATARQARPAAQAPGPARLAQFAILAGCLVFIAVVTFLPDYINNGDGWKSLRESATHDITSALHPVDLWAPVILAAIIFIATIISIWSYARLLRIGILVISLSLAGYTLYIPIKAYPTFRFYGPGYWLSLAAVVVVAVGAAAAATRRREIRAS